MSFRAVVILYLLAWCWLLCGCSAKPSRSSIVSQGGAKVKSAGHVLTAGTIETEDTETEIILPAGSRLELTTPQTALGNPAADSAKTGAAAGSADPSAISGAHRSRPPARSAETGAPRGNLASAPQSALPAIVLSAPTKFRSATHREKISAPVNHTPPAPPSPADLADGRAVWVYRLALLAGLAAAVFGLVRGWDFVMYGGAAVAVAAAVCLFVKSHPVAFAVIGAGVALAGAGVFVWHFRLKEKQTPARPLTVRPN